MAALPVRATPSRAPCAPKCNAPSGLRKAVDESERPHKIVESINATGVDLTQSDLLCNYLFMALGPRSNTVYKQHWRPMGKLLGTDSLEGIVRDDLQRALSVKE